MLGFVFPIFVGFPVPSGEEKPKNLQGSVTSSVVGFRGGADIFALEGKFRTQTKG